MAERSDLELITQAQSGGEAGFAAFEALVARYRERLYRLAFGMTKDANEAEEVVQDAFLSIYKNLDAFRGESTPSTWLYRVATNAALMRLRTKRRKPLPSLEDLDPIEAPQTSIWPGGRWSLPPEELALKDELRQHLEQAIQELPEKYGIVLLLRDVEGLSTSEVAETVGLTVPTVKARLHRARLFVRQKLERYFR
jgi:RNA polymerase sigma-70 factor (ECF subfamily)